MAEVKTKTRGYRGAGPEIVLVGFEEVCPLGYAEDKHLWQKDGSQRCLDLALKMGILEFRAAESGARRLYETKTLPSNPIQQPPGIEPALQRPLDETSPTAIADFEKRWSGYIRDNTGLRQLTLENCGFDPNHFQTLRVNRQRREGLSRAELDFLRSLNLQIENIEARGEHFAATIVGVEDQPFPFPLDIGGPLPTGWRQDNLGLPAKEVRKMNEALLLVYETVYRILLHSTLHPHQQRWDQIYDPKDICLHTPSGMGPMLEIEAIGLATFHREPAKPKQLSHSLANIILGYLAPALRIKGKISTHVGACESVMGGIGDAFRDLKSGMYKAALVVGYDWAMTAVAYNGFVANGAFIVNEQIVRIAKELLDDGVIEDENLLKDVNARIDRERSLTESIAAVDRRVRAGEISKEDGKAEKTRLQHEKLEAFQGLPKRLYEMASMPFHKHRGGFVMSIGSGGGFFTTLEIALENGLPIQALVAGVGEKVPDGPGDGYGSIAVLGDGVGDAFEKAFRETMHNYQINDSKTGALRDATVNDLGGWWAHGTSTPTNGYGERREIHRVAEKLGRDPKRPIPISGDKEIGHRIGGNFPSGAVHILADGVLYPFKNYNLADEEVEAAFPLTQVVGKAGVGQGKPVVFEGEFVAINGAGFGKINSNIVMKRFNLDHVETTEAIKNDYRSKLQARMAAKKTLQEKIRRGELPLFTDLGDTAKSRGETSDLSKLVAAQKKVPL